MVEEIIQPILDDGLENKILSDLFTIWLKQKLMEVDTIQMVKNLWYLIGLFVHNLISIDSTYLLRFMLSQYWAKIKELFLKN